MTREFANRAAAALFSIIAESSLSDPINYPYLSHSVPCCLDGLKISLKEPLKKLCWELVWIDLLLIIQSESQTDAFFVRRIFAYLETLLIWTLSNDYTELSMFLSCFSDVLILSHVSSISPILMFFVENLDRIKKLCLNSVIRQRQLLTIINETLERVSSVLDPEIILILLNITYKIFNASAKSILNVKSDCGALSSAFLSPIQVSNDLDAFYNLLWSVHSRAHSPKLLLTCENRSGLVSMLNDINNVIEKFAFISVSLKEHLRNTPKDKLLSQVKQAFTSRFFACREIFESQINDPYFRRQFLVEIIVFLDILLFYSLENYFHIESYITSHGLQETRNPNVLLNSCSWISESEALVIRNFRTKAFIVLSRIPPKGIEFTDSIAQLIKDETSWMLWKACYCRPNIALESKSYEKHTIDVSLLGDSLLPARFSTPRLNSLCEIIRTDSIPCVFEFPSIESWTCTVEDDAKGEIEPEYQLTTKPHWKWQTFRLFMLKSFNSLTAPTTGFFFRDLVRRYKNLPELTSEEEKEAEKVPMCIDEPITNVEDQKFKKPRYDDRDARRYREDHTKTQREPPSSAHFVNDSFKNSDRDRSKERDRHFDDFDDRNRREYEERRYNRPDLPLNLNRRRQSDRDSIRNNSPQRSRYSEDFNREPRTPHDYRTNYDDNRRRRDRIEPSSPYDRDRTAFDSRDLKRKRNNR